MLSNDAYGETFFGPTEIISDRINNNRSMRITTLKTILFLLVGNYSYGQFNIINNSLVNTSSNVLFVKFRNEISISGNQSNSYNLTSKRKATITKLSATDFIVIPRSTGIDTIRMFEKNKLIYEKVFKVDTLPGFILALGSIKEGLVSKEEIILNKRLQVYFPTCKCPTEFVVDFFKLRFVSHNLAPNEKYMIIPGNALNEKAINLIRRLSSNDQLIFEDIHLQDISSKSRQIEKFVLTLK